MLNNLKQLMIICFLVLLTGTNMTAASAAQSDTAQQINTTITHLEETLKAVNANDLKEAQGHIDAAVQASKHIIGGSYEARKQRGTRAINSIRRQIANGKTDSISASLTEAIEFFKSLLQPVKKDAGGQGGLD